MRESIPALLTLFCLAGWSGPKAIGAEGEWPQWRGPDRTNVSTETGLLKEWPAGGPEKVWTFGEAGQGYSGPAISGGKLFVMGARGPTEYLISVDAGTGKELWSAELGTLLRNNWGDGPRGTPTVDGDRVYALSGRGNLVCARVADGEVLWKTSMQELGGSTPNWGYTESVLVDGDLVVCTPGGSRGAVAALDKMNGGLVWQSKEFTDPAQYASIIAADLNGERQYIQLTMSSLAGISAKEGRLLWSSDWPGRTAVIPTPIFREGYVYVTSGYAVGCKLVKIGEGNEVIPIYRNLVMKNHHGGVVLVGDYLYGHSDGTGWMCQDFKTGEEVWSERSLGKGAVSYADGRLYCLDERTGTVALVEATPEGWKEHGRFDLAPQSQRRSPSGGIWSHPVIAGGKLFLRDQELIHCYDIQERPTRRAGN